MIKSILSALLLSMDFETGYIPRAASSEYLTPQDCKYSATDNVFELTLKPSFEWKFLYGNVELTAFSASPKDGSSFVPFRMSYSNEIGLSYRSKTFSASAGCVINCQHRVIVATYYDNRKMWNDFGYTKFFAKFSFSNQKLP